MPIEYEITVNYDEDTLSATFTCPLCGKEVKFPFPAREISGEPRPSPGTIVKLHLNGVDRADAEPCPRFESSSFASWSVEAIDDVSVKLRLS